MEDKDEPNDVEFIMKDIGGTFGKFQIFSYLMLSYSMFVTGTSLLDYVFTTLHIDHRCRISECDQIDATFKPDWLEYAVPFKNDEPDSCYRYGQVHGQYSDEHNCDINSFNRSMIWSCSNETVIFRTDELSIINEFNLICDDNLWKIAMVGTLSNIGRFILLPIVGYLSDRIGRQQVLVYSTLISSAMKVLKSIAPNYELFVILEMLDGGFNSAIYPTALILGMELATAEHSILISSLILAPFPLGNVMTGFIASYVRNYKWLLCVVSIFGFVTLPYIWFLPESLRWLLVKGKQKKAIEMVESAAKINGITLSQRTYDIIASKCKENANNETVVSTNGSFKDVLFSCSLFTRLLICTFCWIASTFVTYGVSIMSTSLNGDKYVNFMVVSFGAFPSIFLTYYMLKYARRRWSMSVSFLVTGLSILLSRYFSSNQTLSLIFFFMGKLFISHTLSALYLYANEMWPTVLRNSVMGVCSMFGRFGSITAPLTPLLMSIMELLPFYLFGGFAFLSAFIVLFLPETFQQKKLPDSIADIKPSTKKMTKSARNHVV